MSLQNPYGAHDDRMKRCLRDLQYYAEMIADWCRPIDMHPLINLVSADLDWLLSTLSDETTGAPAEFVLNEKLNTRLRSYLKWSDGNAYERVLVVVTDYTSIIADRANCLIGQYGFAETAPPPQ